MKMKFQKVLLSFFIILTLTLAMSSTNAFSSLDITLDMNSLPSAQGWTYGNDYTDAPESSIFSVSGGMLHQNAIWNGAAVGYYITGPNIGDSSFVLTMQAQVNAVAGTGFIQGAGVAIGNASYNQQIVLGLGAGDLSVFNRQNGQYNIYSYNTSQINTYTITYNSDTNIYNVAANGTLIDTGSAFFGTSTPNTITIGDMTNGTFANADYASFSFVQGDATPIPSAVWLFGSGLVGLAGLKRKYLG
jgi:hypothetical protein